MFRRIVLGAIVVVLSSFTAHRCVAQNPPCDGKSNLLSNAGFEDGLAGWRTAVTTSAGKVEICSDAGSASKCVRLHKEDDPSRKIAGVAQDVAVEPDSDYELSFKAKKRLAKYAKKYAFRTRVSTSERPRTEIALEVVTEPYDFGVFRCRFHTPPDCRKITVSIELRGVCAGDAWIDDVVLLPVGRLIKVDWKRNRADLDVCLAKGAHRVRVYGKGAGERDLWPRAVRVSLGNAAQVVDVYKPREKLYGRNGYLRVDTDGETTLTLVKSEDYKDSITVDQIHIIEYDGPVEMKPLFLETKLVVEGKPNAVIVASDATEYKALADRVQECIRRASGAELEIVSDEVFVKGDYESRSAIAIGNLMTNKLSERLYCLQYTIEDGWWPGKGKHVVRSVHNPWGTGTNVIVLAGSDLAGTQEAIRRFANLIKPGRDIILGQTLLTSVKDTLKPDLERLKNEDLPRWKMRTLLRRAADMAIPYLRKGNPILAKYFYICVMEHKRRPILGHDTHMELWKVIRAWDVLEESPSLTDEERLEVTRYLLYLTPGPEGIGSAGYQKCRTIQQNHPMYHGIDGYFAGHYFRRLAMTLGADAYPRLHESANKWIERGHHCLAGMETQDKGRDEAASYEPGSNLARLMIYACCEPSYKLFSSGAARRFTDRVAMTIDNRFRQSGYGDAPACTYFPRQIFSVCAWAYKDGRYQWLVEQRARIVDEGSRATRVPPFFMTGLVEPEEPIDFSGVRVAPLNQEFYDVYSRIDATKLKWNLPCVEAFDKLSFRTAWRSDKQYMLLDGIATGAHGHVDANCIIRLTDNGRMWIVDDTYTAEPFLADHSGVFATRNGIAEPVSACARLDAAADLGAVGLTRTTLPDHSGADWERNIFWVKEECFVVLDRLIALKPGDFGFSCRWRTFGTAALDGNRLITRQDGDGQAFHVVHGGGVSASTRVDPLAAERWSRKLYPHTDSIVNVYCQDVSKSIPAGDTFTFVSLLYATCAREPRSSDITKLDETCAYLTGDPTMLVGLADKGFEMKDLAIQAGQFMVWDNGLALTLAHAFTFDEQPIFASRMPVDVSLDFTNGTCVLQAAEACEVTVMGKHISLKPGKQEHTVVMPAGLSFASVLEDAREKAARAEAQRITPRPKHVTNSARVVWDVNAGSPVTALLACDLDLDGKTEVTVGTDDGIGLILSEDGKQRWRFAAKGRINAIAAGDLNADGKRELVFGSQDSNVYAFDQTGRSLWTFACPTYPKGRHARGQVRDLLLSDLDGDDKVDIIVSPNNYRVHVLTAQGKERTHFSTLPQHGYVMNHLVTLDIDADGKKEILSFPSNGSFGHFYYWTLSGRASQGSTDGWPSYIPSFATGDINGDGKMEIACGTNRGNVHYVRQEQGRLKGNRVFAMGCSASAMAFHSPDGKAGIVAVGSEASYVHVLDHNGKVTWKHNTGSPVTDVKFLKRKDGAWLLAVGTMRDGVLFFGPKGQLTGRFLTGSAVNILQVVNGQPDGAYRVAAGCADGRVQLLQAQFARQ